MKTLISLSIFVIISISLFGQQKNEVDYLKEWNEFRKENAPFNTMKKENITIEELNNKVKPKLGDLSYKRESFTIGEELVGVALHVTAAIKDNLDYKNEIWKDPAKYFLEGYY